MEPKVLSGLVAEEKSGRGDLSEGSCRRTVLYVVNDLAYFVSHRLGLAKSGMKRGNSVIVCSPAQENAPELRRLGVVHISMPLARWSMNPFSELRSLLFLCSLYRAVKPDVVHHLTIKPIIYGTLAARVAKVPAVVNAVSGLGYMFSRRGSFSLVRRLIATILYKISMRHPNQTTIFQNNENEQFFQRWILPFGSRTRLIAGSGIDLEEFSLAEEPATGEPVVLMVARLIFAKGILEFVEAARKLKKKGVKARFVLVGPAVPGNPDGVPLDLLQSWMDEGIIELWGYQRDMQSCLSRSHIVCLPTRYQEGFPRIILESAACGRPVVTTPAIGDSDFVRDGETGVIIPPNDPETLSSAIKLLLDDPEMRRYMGAEARAALERGGFSDGEISRATFEVYENLHGSEAAEQASDSSSSASQEVVADQIEPEDCLQHETIH